MKLSRLAIAALPFFAIALAPAMAQDKSMGFFITSVGSGNGGNLGGLAGADAHCAKLAEAAGSTGRTWKAYLSTQGRRQARRPPPVTASVRAPGTMQRAC